MCLRFFDSVLWGMFADDEKRQSYPNLTGILGTIDSSSRSLRPDDAFIAYVLRNRSELLRSQTIFSELKFRFGQLIN